MILKLQKNYKKLHDDYLRKAKTTNDSKNYTQK